MANFVRFPWLFSEQKAKRTCIILYQEPLYTLVGHNLEENAHKSSFLRGWDVMKDKYRA